jgi:hypothetical protein
MSGEGQDRTSRELAERELYLLFRSELRGLAGKCDDRLREVVEERWKILTLESARKRGIHPPDEEDAAAAFDAIRHRLEGDIDLLDPTLADLIALLKRKRLSDPVWKTLYALVALMVSLLAAAYYLGIKSAPVPNVPAVARPL